jgi:hypothetical protein
MSHFHPAVDIHLELPTKSSHQSFQDAVATSEGRVEPEQNEAVSSGLFKELAHVPVSQIPQPRKDHREHSRLQIQRIGPSVPISTDNIENWNSASQGIYTQSHSAWLLIFYYCV